MLPYMCVVLCMPAIDVALLQCMHSALVYAGEAYLQRQHPSLVPSLKGVCDRICVLRICVALTCTQFKVFTEAHWGSDCCACLRYGRRLGRPFLTFPFSESAVANRDGSQFQDGEKVDECGVLPRADGFWVVDQLPFSAPPLERVMDSFFAKCKQKQAADPLPVGEAHRIWF